MFSGLESWEIIALAGVCGLAYTAVAAVVGVAAAWLVYGEKAPRPATVAAAKPAAHPTPMAAPGYSPATA